MSDNNKRVPRPRTPEDGTNHLDFTRQGSVDKKPVSGSGFIRPPMPPKNKEKSN